jgi:hypothetical protein
MQGLALRFVVPILLIDKPLVRSMRITEGVKK